MSDGDWETLLGRIEDGRCTPFLGAGANAGILPTGIDLAGDWSTAYKYPLREGSGDLSRVAQFVAIHKNDHMWPKEELLRQFKRRTAAIDLTQQLSKSIVSSIASLPLPVYMTTNYDDFLSRSLTAQGKHPQTEICRWNDFLQRNRKPILGTKFSPSTDEPVVFHFHGHQDVAESLVLTEDDYLDFLISIARDPKLIPPRIQQAIAYSSLLFLGYRLADLNFRVLFRSLLKSIEDTLRRTNVAVQLPPQDGPLAQDYLDRYFGNVQVKVYWGSVEEFVKELMKRWQTYHT